MWYRLPVPPNPECPPVEAWTDSEILYTGRVFNLRVGHVRIEDNGATAQREVVEHPGGVAVVPYTGDAVLLVRQYRIAIGDYALELPAGKLEPGDSDPAARGAAELEEECGYRAGRLDFATHLYGCIGFCSEKVHIYIARDLTHVGQRLETDERIEVIRLGIDDVRAGLRAGRFVDAKTAVGLQALLYQVEEAPHGR